jgi:hypothetical protein
MATSDDHLPGMRLVQASLAALREALIEAASESIGSSDQHIWMMVMGAAAHLLAMQTWLHRTQRH